MLTNAEGNDEKEMTPGMKEEEQEVEKEEVEEDKMPRVFSFFMGLKLL